MLPVVASALLLAALPDAYGAAIISASFAGVIQLFSLFYRNRGADHTREFPRKRRKQKKRWWSHMLENPFKITATFLFAVTAIFGITSYNTQRNNVRADKQLLSRNIRQDKKIAAALYQTCVDTRVAWDSNKAVIIALTVHAKLPPESVRLLKDPGDLLAARLALAARDRTHDNILAHTQQILGPRPHCTPLQN